MCLAEEPHAIERCAVGQGNYVYIVECARDKYVVRCSEEQNAYNETVYWLRQLETLQIPVPKVMGTGKMEGYEYVVLSYFEGQDIGLVYEQLTEDDKQAIAKEIVLIQERVAALKLEDVPADWTWKDFIDEMLDRAAERIVQNGYFEVETVERLAEQSGRLAEYFAQMRLSRQTARDEAVELLQETIAYAEGDGTQDSSAKLEEIIADALMESQIESLVVAKGYRDCVAYISEDGISIAVAAPEDGLTQSDVSLVADIVLAQTDFTLSDIRVIGV